MSHDRESGVERSENGPSLKELLFEKLDRTVGEDPFLESSAGAGGAKRLEWVRRALLNGREVRRVLLARRQADVTGDYEPDLSRAAPDDKPTPEAAALRLVESAESVLAIQFGRPVSSKALVEGVDHYLEQRIKECTADGGLS